MNPKEITAVFVCYNESRSIGVAISAYREIGIKTFLVVDDASGDDTRKIALRAGAKVLTNDTLMGFNLSALKGLYAVTTPFALVVDPDMEAHPRSLRQFLEFGIMGGYAVLLASATSNRLPGFSTFMKKRFGLFLAEPSFRAVLLDKRILALIKDKVSGGGVNIFFDVIRAAVNAELKLGVFPLPLSASVGGVSRTASLLFRIKERRRQRQYLRYAFPDLFKQQLRRDLLVGSVTGVLVAAFTWMLSKY